VVIPNQSLALSPTPKFGVGALGFASLRARSLKTLGF